MSFAELKKQSRLGNLTAKLVKEVDKMNKTSSMGDDRLWKIERYKSGNGYAVIRFLPAPNGEENPYVQVWSHAFQGPGGWYIENSLTTIGQKDPLGELNTQLWATGNKADQEVVRQRKRKLSYYSNIYVVKDPAHPENEGKVFLFKYGKKIFEKISSALKPEFEDESPMDAFDLWNGANFKLKVRMADGYPNYDKSEFESASVLGGLEDEDLERIWKQCYSLDEFVSPSNFKTYEQLKARLDAVLGNKTSKKVADESFENEDDNRGSYKPLTEDLRSELNSLSSSKVQDEDDEDDTLSYFQRLAEE
jgi:hypothetical protein